MQKGFKSRKFISAVVAFVVALVAAIWDINIDTAEIMTVISPFLTYIGVEGAIDLKTANKKVEP